jgi:hypothetical protein
MKKDMRNIKKWFMSKIYMNPSRNRAAQASMACLYMFIIYHWLKVFDEIVRELKYMGYELIDEYLIFIFRWLTIGNSAFALSALCLCSVCSLCLSAVSNSKTISFWSKTISFWSFFHKTISLRYRLLFMYCWLLSLLSTII